MRKQEFTRYLANDRFEDLFIELGWNDYDGDRLLYPTDVDGMSFDFYVVAQQSGFMVLKCEVSELPTTALYKKLDTQIRKSAHEFQIFCPRISRIFAHESHESSRIFINE